MIIYIDDSGTSPENAVAVAAGWIAHTDSWVDFHRACLRMRKGLQPKRVFISEGKVEMVNNLIIATATQFLYSLKRKL